MTLCIEYGWLYHIKSAKMVMHCSANARSESDALLESAGVQLRRVKRHR